MGKYLVHKAIDEADLSAKVRNSFEADTLWVASPKYDGCHAVFLFDDCKFVSAISRAGEVVRSMTHIGAAFEEDAVLPLGKVAICGEAWNPHLAFNDISGAFRQFREATELQFVPFDYTTWEYNTDTTSPPNILLNPYGIGGTYINRLTHLLRRIREVDSRVIHPTWHLFRGSLAQAVAEFTPQAQALKELGVYDGIILADADGHYKPGPGSGGEFIKLKPVVSFTVTVRGAELSKGAKTGKNTAALVFELDDKRQLVSTGLTQAQVDEIATTGWVGKRIEVEAMGKTVNGLLREPRFNGIRTDA